MVLAHLSELSPRFGICSNVWFRWRLCRRLTFILEVVDAQTLWMLSHGETVFPGFWSGVQGDGPTLDGASIAVRSFSIPCFDDE